MTTPRIEEMVEEFENLNCVNYAMYFGCVDKVCDCGEEKCRNRQTVEMAEQEYKTWLRQALTEAHQAGRDEAVALLKEARKSAPEFSSLSVSVPVHNPTHELLAEEENGWNQCKERYEMLLNNAIKALQDNK